MSHYVLEDGQVGEKYPYYLTKNGIKVFGGTSAACYEVGLALGEDSDTFDCGVGKYSKILIGDDRIEFNERLNLCGFKPFNPAKVLADNGVFVMEDGRVAAIE